MFSKYINYQVFFISLCAGILVCYLIHPKPRIILKCPNPDNQDKVIYKDTFGSCFKYKSEEVACPTEDKIETCSHKK